MEGDPTRDPAEGTPAADSLRQHDLVQVQRVLLSPDSRTPLSRIDKSDQTPPKSRRQATGERVHRRGRRARAAPGDGASPRLHDALARIPVLRAAGSCRKRPHGERRLRPHGHPDRRPCHRLTFGVPSMRNDIPAPGAAPTRPLRAAPRLLARPDAQGCIRSVRPRPVESSGRHPARLSQPRRSRSSSGFCRRTPSIRRVRAGSSA